MVNHHSRVSESGAIKQTNSKTKFKKLAKYVENLFVWKHDYIKFQTKQVYILYRNYLSNRQFMSQPLEQKSPIQAEKNNQ